MNSYDIGDKIRVKGRFGTNPTVIMAESAAGSTAVTVANTSGYSTGDVVIVNPGDLTEEMNTLASITGRVFGFSSGWIHPHHIRERLWERTDPTVTTLKVRTPGGATNSYTTAAGLSSAEGAGLFTYDITATAAGTYYYRWAGTGAAESAGEGQFNVRPSQFAS